MTAAGHTDGDRRVVLRCAAADDVGLPGTAFPVCDFRSVDALAMTGQTEEARERFEPLLGHRAAFGMPSEDLDAATGEFRGNFPQTCSVAGTIDCATRLSKSWEDAW